MVTCVIYKDQMNLSRVLGGPHIFPQRHQPILASSLSYFPPNHQQPTPYSPPHYPNPKPIACMVKSFPYSINATSTSKLPFLNHFFPASGPNLYYHNLTNHHRPGNGIDSLLSSSTISIRLPTLCVELSANCIALAATSRRYQQPLKSERAEM